MLRKETIKKTKEERVLALDITQKIIKEKQEEEKERNQDIFKDMT